MSKLELIKERNLFNAPVVNVGMKDGTEIEKGFLINEEFLIRNEKHLQKLFAYWTAYPDVFLDIITPSDSNVKLFFYQRILLRALMRYKEVFVTAPRAFSKSFITILALILQCIFIPNSKRFICANTIKQAVKIAKEKLEEIFRFWPLLRREVVGWELKDLPGNYGADYVTLNFRAQNGEVTGSRFDVVAALDSTRGGRRHQGLIDEVRDGDEDAISKVVLPLIAVKRRLPDNTINPKEPNPQIIYATSAGTKGTFAYEKLISIFQRSIIDPDYAFCLGCDYRVPLLHGLIDRNFVNNLKMDPSYKEETFAAEYLSQWVGGSEDAWFSYDKLQKYRKIKNPEWHAKTVSGVNQFYLISVDVGRLHDQTVVTVFRVNVTENGYYATVVNIYILGRTPETKPFSVQARDLKEIIFKYNPTDVVIDANGLGIGLCDEMIKTQFSEDGTLLPPYGFTNNDDYLKIQPREAVKILYSVKANQSLKSQINGNAFSWLHSGKVRFLIKEQEAKSELLATKVGQKMTTEQRIKRLMPHEMTTRLFEEMGNLRMKRTGTDVVLEPINSRFPDDKYYSFAYGLWRIKELEEEYQKRRRRVGSAPRRLIFFTGGN